MTGPTEVELSERIWRILSDDLLVDSAGFTQESELRSFGLDSLALTQLLLELEEQTGYWLDEGRLNEGTLKNCRSLAACMASFIRENSR